MSTVGSFNSKNPTIKRILKEASELQCSPSADYHAAPLETNLFEWHFTLRGPPSPSPFASGIYHGRITLPAEYPLRPPSFRFLTPSGRFEVGSQICLSISGFHEETWQPAWGIRTALVALRSFMDTKAGGQVGGVESTDDARKIMAKRSTDWKCLACGRSNHEILDESANAAKESGRKEEEKVPEELRMVAKEELDRQREAAKQAAERPRERIVDDPLQSRPRGLPGTGSVSVNTSPAARQNVPIPPEGVQVQLQRQQMRNGQSRDDWLDKAIYGIALLLAFLVARKMLTLD